MKTIKKHLKLNRFQYYQTHLKIVNALLPISLTSKEIDVLAKFMELNYKDKFCTSARKEVRETLNLSYGGLGNYLKSLEEKNFIYRERGTYEIVPVIIPNSSNQLYQFKLEVNE